MIKRLNPLLPVETPLGKGNALFYLHSEIHGDQYWVVNPLDNSIRLFNSHEIKLPETHTAMNNG